MKINVICANDSVEAIVPLPECWAKTVIEKLALRDFRNNKGMNGKDYWEYRKQVYWHIHKVPIRLRI